MRVCSHTQNDVMSARFPHHRHLLLLRHRYSHTHIRIYLNHVQMAKVRFYDRIETSPFQIFYFLATLVIRFAFFLRDVEPNFHTSRNKNKKKALGWPPDPSSAKERDVKKSDVETLNHSQGRNANLFFLSFRKETDSMRRARLIPSIHQSDA